MRPRFAGHDDRRPSRTTGICAEETDSTRIDTYQQIAASEATLAHKGALMCVSETILRGATRSWATLGVS